MSPRPTPREIGQYYPDSYAPYQPAIDEERWAAMRWMRRRNLSGRCDRIVRRFPQPGRLLDVGSATGNFLAEMRRRDWNVQGVELSPNASQYARLHLGLNVYTGDLLEADFPPGSFDVITLWDVLEHVHDPVATLVRIRELLRPGGLLAVNVPDPASLDAFLFGRHWIGYDTPRHLWAFPKPVLSRLFRMSGFSQPLFEHFIGGYYTYLCSLQNWLEADRPRDSARRLMSLLRVPGVRLPIAPVFWALNRAHLGPTVTAWANSEPT